MALHYRRSIDGDSVIPSKNFPLNATYAATAKKGDLVRLNASGEVVLAATGDTSVLGVLEGLVFEGAGQAFKTGQVRISGNAVYEADFVGEGALTVGTSYGIDGASNMDTDDTTVTILKIVEVVNGKPYVVIASRQLA